MRNIFECSLLLILSACCASSCSGVSGDVDSSQMDGCYDLDGRANLALRDEGIFLPGGRSPLAAARYRRLRTGAYVLVTPELLMNSDGSLRAQAPGSHRFVPLQIDRDLLGRSHVRLLFPESDGIGFQFLYKHAGQTC